MFFFSYFSAAFRVMTTTASQFPRGYIRDRDQDRVPGFRIGYIIRDFGTAGYIRDGLFANEPSRIYPAVPISRIYPIPNPGTRSWSRSRISESQIPAEQNSAITAMNTPLPRGVYYAAPRWLCRQFLFPSPWPETMTSHTRLVPPASGCRTKNCSASPSSTRKSAKVRRVVRPRRKILGDTINAGEPLRRI